MMFTDMVGCTPLGEGQEARDNLMLGWQCYLCRDCGNIVVEKSNVKD